MTEATATTPDTAHFRGAVLSTDATAWLCWIISI
jgi:hypothetical protein